MDTEEFRTPSEDSGVCLGDVRPSERGTITTTSPVYRKQTSDLALSNEDCSNTSQVL
ncbi:UNVERIFIED_CONTAM: hypothetical protein PYX00_006484 [Menopon gallinae]|uniref:Uncharacterized protein n=1 Tax=Menopon gallinae TaxID=328185 RepID=A0AAW2HXD1_9NEOP